MLSIEKYLLSGGMVRDLDSDQFNVYEAEVGQAVLKDATPQPHAVCTVTVNGEAVLSGEVFGCAGWWTPDRIRIHGAESSLCRAIFWLDRFQTKSSQLRNHGI